jgi:prepilin-type N-terminal cleavage/methylation domain-containing protein
MERQKMKKKGFTLVELLVVIAIIAMLLAILMPALGKVRQLAQRIMCGTNLTGIGKAMLTYATDDEYESYPISGISSTIWDRGSGNKGGKCSTWDWRDPDVYAKVDTAKFATATVTSCLYLVIKYSDVAPEQFICPGSDQKKFELSKYDTSSFTQVNAFTQVWDFGAYANQLAGYRGKGHNSYSYQFPLKHSGLLKAYPITTTTNPAKAVMADRNPFWQYDGTTESGVKTAGTVYSWDQTNQKICATSVAKGNASYHQKDGQNVLYADQHSKFERIANCGIESDNIYTAWGQPTINPANEEQKRQCGKGASTSCDNPSGDSSKPTQADDYGPVSEYDSYLVCDLDNDT